MIKSDIKLIKNYTSHRGTLNADSNKLKHVFFNIFKNGIEAIGNSGTLIVSTSSVKGRFKIEINDTGCGIKKGTVKS